MATNRQEPLIDQPSGPRARIWCSECKVELKDPISRSRRMGPECDPEPRHTSPRFDIDQDAIPGL
jgi:hypothetical protein